jgi:hypothetical protein
MRNFIAVTVLWMLGGTVSCSADGALVARILLVRALLARALVTNALVARVSVARALAVRPIQWL